ncbi:MAG: immunity 17 family protein [Neisseriaceae bacterium]|nr:immunity 17 family protein [Neisseriaceae bacterium]
MVTSILMVICGVFCLCAAIFDWDFFFNNYRARPFIRIFGRNGSRVFYALLGIFVIFVSLRLQHVI